MNEFGITEGDLWSFTTADELTAPHTPTPEDGAVGVSVSTSLSWEDDNEPAGSVFFYVCIGTDESEVESMDYDDPDAINALNAMTINPTSAGFPLSPGTTYYWKVIVTDFDEYVSSEVWSFTTGEAASVTWTLIDDAGDIGHRGYFDMAWNGSNIILYGGLVGADVATAVYDDSTYMWDGVAETWVSVATVANAYKRAYHKMCYDGDGGVILFGGQYPDPDNESMLAIDNYVYRFVDSNWEVIDVGQDSVMGFPFHRRNHAMAYDEVRNTAVLFSGQLLYQGSWVLHNDTWEINLDNLSDLSWRSVSTSFTPPAVRYSGMAFIGDGTSGQVGIFGGLENAGNASSRTFLFDGANWAEVTGYSAPGVAAGHAFKGNPDVDENYAVLVGGAIATGISNTVYIFDGDTETWEMAAPTAGSDPPPSLYCFGMAYDRTSGRFIIYGGYDETDTGQNLTYTLEVHR